MNGNNGEELFDIFNQLTTLPMSERGQLLQQMLLRPTIRMAEQREQEELQRALSQSYAEAEEQQSSEEKLQMAIEWSLVHDAQKSEANDRKSSVEEEEEEEEEEEKIETADDVEREEKESGKEDKLDELLLRDVIAQSLAVVNDPAQSIESPTEVDSEEIALREKLIKSLEPLQSNNNNNNNNLNNNYINLNDNNNNNTNPVSSSTQPSMAPAVSVNEVEMQKELEETAEIERLSQRRQEKEAQNKRYHDAMQQDILEQVRKQQEAEAEKKAAAAVEKLLGSASELPPAPSSDEPSVDIALRLPHGVRCSRRFSLSSPLSVVHKWAAIEWCKASDLSLPPSFSLASSFPRRSYSDLSLSLLDANLTGRILLHVETHKS